MHWRETMRPTRFFILDGRAALFLLIAAVDLSLEVIVAVLVLMGVLMWAEREGLTVPAALRFARQKVAGVLQYLNPKVWVSGLGSRLLRPRNHRPVTPLTRTRAMVDPWPAERRLMVQGLRRNNAGAGRGSPSTAAATSAKAKGQTGAKRSRR